MIPKNSFLLVFLALMCAHIIGAVSKEVEANIEKLKKTNSCEGCNLKGANLKELNLRGANLRKASLKNAKFHGSDLREADLSGSTDMELNKVSVNEKTKFHDGLSPDREYKSLSWNPFKKAKKNLKNEEKCWEKVSGGHWYDTGYQYKKECSEK